MQVSTFEAKNRLGALLAEVARGVEVTITKRGEPVLWFARAAPRRVVSVDSRERLPAAEVQSQPDAP